MIDMNVKYIINKSDDKNNQYPWRVVVMYEWDGEVIDDVEFTNEDDAKSFVYYINTCDRYNGVPNEVNTYWRYKS